MCLFKRKQKEIIESKYHLGDRVGFKRKQDLMLGYIYKVYKDKNDKVHYDVQIGGECPAIIEDVAEEIMFLRK